MRHRGPRHLTALFRPRRGHEPRRRRPAWFTGRPKVRLALGAGGALVLLGSALVGAAQFASETQTGRAGPPADPRLSRDEPSRAGERPTFRATPSRSAGEPAARPRRTGEETAATRRAAPAGTPDASRTATTPEQTAAPSPTAAVTRRVERVRQTAATAAPRASTSRADRTPPQTVLDGHPAQHGAAGAATFLFHASEAASFACSVDGAAFRPCVSGVTYAALEPGWHEFAVRATDRAGNVDPTPASWRWQTSADPR